MKIRFSISVSKQRSNQGFIRLHGMKSLLAWDKTECMELKTIAGSQVSYRYIRWTSLMHLHRLKVTLLISAQAIYQRKPVLKTRKDIPN